ncbi:Inn1 protein [Saccharomycopsis crataegensis]|uniref:Inn1 protein n=1 Tax=Saccharomycopsis crataegensis TaxID=43959 RepID=A0AAV5QSP0_9ASCO|nr:Inn1 protein [Saccharomycopsis crataegensis]
MSDLRGSGTLIIVILKARNLPNRRKLDKQNPYCIARIANIVDRTPAIARGGQTPEWNHESRFQLTSDINPLLKVSILDETKKQPVLIGDAEIDCSPVFNTSSEDGYDKWHPLQYAGRTAGEVYVEMTFYPSAPTEQVKKKGAVTLHRNTIRPLPIRPGEEDSFVSLDDNKYLDDDYRDDYDARSDYFRSHRSKSPLKSSPYSSVAGDSNYSEVFNDAMSDEYSRRSRLGNFQATQNSSAFQGSQRTEFSSIFDDSIARQILKENPEKFEELLSRNPELAQSIMSRAGNPSMISDYSSGRYFQSQRSISPSRTSQSTSPVRRPAHQQRNMRSINASFDDLEKEVQTDWYRNNFGTSRYSQFMDDGRSKSRSPVRQLRDQDSVADPMKISTILPKLPEFNTSKVLFQNFGTKENVPPPPPHKSTTSRYSNTSNTSAGSGYGTSMTSISTSSDRDHQSYYSKKSFSPFPKKKAPPKNYDEEIDGLSYRTNELRLNSSNNSNRSW